MQIPFIFLIDIDGLRHDVIAEALQKQRIPNLQRILGADPNLYPIASTAPSITFCAQASIFTGTPPNIHGTPGNQFFDRFGTHNKGTPRFYTFDVGDQLGFLDAIQVFNAGLANERLAVPTIYQTLANHGIRSMVTGNMYAKGAEWIKPSILDLARLTKAPPPFRLSSEAYDAKLGRKTRQAISRHGLPNLLTFYFKGLDDFSHRHGPKTQLEYLITEVDPEIGKLWDFILATKPSVEENYQALVFSDHGQIETVPDKNHALRMGFPFEMDFAPIFEAFNLDPHDFPGEGPHTDAVAAMNGGMAYIYLRAVEKDWQAKPSFTNHILPLANAFWQASQTGKYSPELKDTLSAVLVKDVEKEGWQAPYQALTPAGELIPLSDWFEYHQKSAYRPIERIEALNSPLTGEIILLANYEAGFYFAPINTGMHGGLDKQDSIAFLAHKKSPKTSVTPVPTSITDIATVLFELLEIS